MFLLLHVGLLMSALFSTAIIPVSGQCTTHDCQEFSSKPEEEDLVVKTFEAYDQRLQSLSFAMEQLYQKMNADFKSVEDSLQRIRSQAITEYCPNSPVVCDCSELKANGHTRSGVYRVYVVDQSQRYYASVYCDMTTANSSWTVFQRRKDGSVDFYRGWIDYENGFGNSSGEYWLGNDFLYLLTSKKRYRLRIELEDFEGQTRYAEYSTFKISSSADKYRLTVKGYSGSAGDSLGYHNNSQFSTKDSGPAIDCAIRNHGAWWYNGCAYSNLNSHYLRGPYTSKNCSLVCTEGIWWHHWHGYWYSLKTTEMKISSSVPYK